MKRKTMTLEPDWGIDFGKPPQIEVRLVEVQGNNLYVIGITHSTIKVGDIFTKICIYSARQNPEDTICDAPETISLKVRSISAYHNSLSQVNTDMTVGMVLQGDATPLTEMIDLLDWTFDAGQYHQWTDKLSEATKMILTS